MEETARALLEVQAVSRSISDLVVDDSDVSQRWLRQEPVGGSLCIHLKGLTLRRTLLHDDVLQVALVTFIPIDRIVIVVGEHTVLHVDITTVELDAVIRVAVNLDVIHFSTAANGH